MDEVWFNKNSITRAKPYDYFRVERVMSSEYNRRIALSQVDLNVVILSTTKVKYSSAWKDNIIKQSGLRLKCYNEPLAKNYTFFLHLYLSMK